MGLEGGLQIPSLPFPFFTSECFSSPFMSGGLLGGCLLWRTCRTPLQGCWGSAGVLASQGSPGELLSWLDWLGWFLIECKCFSSDASVARGGCDLLRSRHFLPPECSLPPFPLLPWRFATCLC